MNWIKGIIDGDDLRVVATGIVVVLIIGLALVILGLFAGCAVGVFEAASGVG